MMPTFANLSDAWPARNAVRIGNVSQCTSVQVTHDLNHAALNGFVVLDSAHEFLSYTDDVVVALRRLRENGDAMYVHRCSDDALIATKLRGRKRGGRW